MVFKAMLKLLFVMTFVSFIVFVTIIDNATRLEIKYEFPNTVPNDFTIHVSRKNKTCDQMRIQGINKILDYLRRHRKVHPQFTEYYNRTKTEWGFRGVTFPTIVSKLTEKPAELSFVVTSRNDGYGGDSTYRLARSMQQILNYPWSIYVEFVLVEWNAVTPFLHDVEIIKEVVKKRNGNVNVKIIQVPSKYAQMPNLVGKNCSMFEYIAKNVGMRRSEGEWILITNIDDIFPTNLLSFIDMGIKYNKFDTNGFHTCRRGQLFREIDRTLPYVGTLDNNAHDGFYEETNDCQMSTSNRDIGYVGDFEMFHRKTLGKTGGFLEVYTNFALDSEFLFRNLMVNNLTGYVIGGRCSYKHQKHTKRKTGF